ncbi:ABC transporter substrate-binding protein [Beijerinckia sp. L45]|uniref:ABC transporter substrate-binding protein n=1 Tax=Beijerinckia sp. L45 TaxID=1641855 RepID=UPI00131C5D60|nr:ABC transporter substrate-binding protein [Beijerinckia sp. L45]
MAVFAAALQSSQRPVRAATLEPWRHAVVEEKGDAGIVLMAGQPNIADKHGLKIDYVQLKGDALALKALLAGEVDSFEGSPGGAIIAASRGADLKVLGCYWPGLSYGVFAPQAITSIEQLQGKVVAISSPGSLPDLVVKALLDEHGIPVGGVHFAAMGGDADRFRSLSAGVVAAAALSMEFVPTAAQHGLKLLVDAHTELPKYLRVCTFVTGDGLRRRRNATVGFIAAQMDGVHFAQLHRLETIDLTRSALKIGPDDPRPAYVYDDAMRDGMVDSTMPLPLDRLKWMEELLQRTGNIGTPFDVGTMVDPTVRVQAAAQTIVK